MHDRARADRHVRFMMDCDTTGIEPDIALVKYKLVGEGYLKIVNNTVPLLCVIREVEEIVAYIDERETIEGAPRSARRTRPSSTAPSSRATGAG